ncbi:MAG: hypothetical protein HKO81_05085 [Flavobacteriaceae bacterium]|nr:hypothetical protein [Flavobacteriaceae bacterium]
MEINIRLITALICFFSILGCINDRSGDDDNQDEKLIRAVHSDYVQGWLDMNQDKVMSLLMKDSRIQPNSLKPIEGKNNIKKFWFPNDDSKTIINDYKTEILDLRIMDTLAYTTHNSILDWSYKKDSISFSMLQKAINTTVYRKDNNGKWKIWRSMWTDIYSERK